MLPEKADAAYLWDMLDAARAIKEFVAGKTLHDYQKNRMLRGAVERHVEIIGEAANRVSAGFQSSHPEIDSVRSGLDRDYLPMQRIFEKVIAKTLRGYGNRSASS